MRVRWMLGVLLSLLCGACAINIPAPPAVQALDVTKTRPEGTIGPEERPTIWRKFSLRIAKTHIMAVHRFETTFHFLITDCGGRYISAQDLYVENVALNALSGVADAEFDRWYKELHDPAQAFFYVKETAFAGESQLCGQFSGGGYTGFKIRNKQFRIK
jgi:hypothetical protein